MYKCVHVCVCVCVSVHAPTVPHTDLQAGSQGSLCGTQGREHLGRRGRPGPTRRVILHALDDGKELAAGILLHR